MKRILVFFVVGLGAVTGATLVARAQAPVARGRVCGRAGAAGRDRVRAAAAARRPAVNPDRTSVAAFSSTGSSAIRRIPPGVCRMAAC